MRARGAAGGESVGARAGEVLKWGAASERAGVLQDLHPVSGAASA